MTEFTLFDDQALAGNILIDRVRAGHSKSSLAGYAGTGKTTLMRWLSSQLTLMGWYVMYGAPTGKAASRLSSVVGSTVLTLHSLIYRRVTESTAGRPIFLEPRERLSPSGQAALIVDEASMVSLEVAQDLERSAGTSLQIVYVGDDGQLLPVASKPGVDLANPDARLTTVRRQALEDPILAVATAVRSGQGLTQGKVGHSYERRSGSLMEAAQWLIDRRAQGRDAVILCSTNDLRKRANKLVRHLTQAEGVISVGEQLVVLYNNKFVGWMNGDTLRVEDFAQAPGAMGDAGLARITVDGIKYLIHTPSMGKDVQEFKKAQALVARFDGLPVQSLLHVDYGNALTVHKSQGSEFADVCYVTDWATKSRVRQTGEAGLDDWKRMAYTAVTRAKQSCLVLDVP